MSERKNYEIRKTELLDVAAQLFAKKGYEATTINDILQVVGIGKGTFYYYFKSKEEIMNAVIARMVTVFETDARKISEDETLTAHQKFANILLGQSNKINHEEWMLEELHKVENARLHQKSITETLLAVSPYLANVVKQGIKEGTFNTPYPTETLEIILIANQFIFDAGIFQWTKNEFLKRAEVFIYSMEILLGTEKGSFNYILENFINQSEGEENAK